MASNFRILTHQNNGDLHLKLKGDFDGSSAFELINALKAHNGRAGKIVIDTSGLAKIYPFGMDVFQRNCTLIRKPSHALCITGKYANSLDQSGRSVTS